MDLFKAFDELGEEMVPYFRKYTHDRPLIMSLQTYERTRQLGMVLKKTIEYLVEHYADYVDRMALSSEDLRVLGIASRYPFRIGTYRTDFVLDQSKSIRIIEMTTRQPLNAYAVSGFTNVTGMEMAQRMQLKGVVNDYPRFLDFLQNDFLKSGKVTVIKGNERLGDFKIYARWFERAGIDFQVVSPDELPRKLHTLADARVIEELNHREILAMPDLMIDELCAAGIFNDFRNLFLVHDKRFFALLSDSAFQHKALSANEREILTAFLVPTYTLPEHPEQFEEARKNKTAWILKSIRFGKSEGIYAGCVTAPQLWEELFSSGRVKELVLQPMIRQSRFKGTIGAEIREDYVAGTFLYFDDQYYGPGIYRASSFEVTNVKDDRKLAQVVAERDGRYKDITI